MSRTNETSHLNEICACRCRLDASVCKDKQSWNSDRFRRECKALIDEGRCDDGFCLKS